MPLRRPDYDDSPGAVNLPLTLEDIDWLLENNRAGLKDVNRRQHLLVRMRNTLLEYKNAINNLHREIGNLQNELAAPQVTTSLNPTDAAKFLSDAQKEQLFVGSMRQAWTGLLRLREEAVTLKAQANSELGRARFAIQRVLDTTPLGDQDREQLELLLAKLPDAGELILPHVPSPLEDLPEAPGATVTPARQEHPHQADPEAAPHATDDTPQTTREPGAAEPPEDVQEPAVQDGATHEKPDRADDEPADDLSSLFA